MDSIALTDSERAAPTDARGVGKMWATPLAITSPPDYNLSHLSDR